MSIENSEVITEFNEYNQQNGERPRTNEISSTEDSVISTRKGFITIKKIGGETFDHTFH